MMNPRERENLRTAWAETVARYGLPRAGQHIEFKRRRRRGAASRSESTWMAGVVWYAFACPGPDDPAVVVIVNDMMDVDFFFPSLGDEWRVPSDQASPDVLPASA